jgi:pyrroline-5-carboxylate reductase
MPNSPLTLSIIGAGNIGTAIAQGLIDSSKTLVDSIILTKRNLGSLAHFTKHGVQLSSNNDDTISKSDIVILALQPAQIVPFIQKHQAILLEKKPLLASVATNITLEQMQTALSPSVETKSEALNIPLYRIMPNTAIAVKESMTCISRTNTTTSQDEFIEALFSTVGQVLFINDELMNAATVLCACGTAFALRYIRAASQGGTEIGFHAEDALKLAAQTVKGAATLITQTNQHPEQAIDQVTTPMGCTIAGMNEMEHQGFSSAAIKGIRRSYERAKDI